MQLDQLTFVLLPPSQLFFHPNCTRFLNREGIATSYPIPYVYDDKATHPATHPINGNSPLPAFVHFHTFISLLVSFSQASPNPFASPPRDLTSLSRACRPPFTLPITKSVYGTIAIVKAAAVAHSLVF